MVIKSLLTGGKKKMINNLFFKKSVGLDITDSSIAVVQIKKQAGRLRVLKLAKATLPVGLVEKGRIKDREKLLQAINKVMAKAKPSAIETKEISFAFSEHQIYPTIFRLKKTTDKALKQKLIQKQAENNIPLPKKGLTYTWQSLSSDKDYEEILLIAISREVLEEWYYFFHEAKFKIKTFDIRSLAFKRAVLKAKIVKPVAIVEIKPSSSLIAIFNKTGFRYSHSINLGSQDFTEGKIPTQFWQDIKKSFDYFQQKNKESVAKVILINDLKEAKELSDALTTHLKLPVVPVKIDNLLSKISSGYIGAVGLAMKSLSKKDLVQDLSFKLQEVSHQLEETDVKLSHIIPNTTTSSDSINLGLNRKIHYQKVLLIMTIILGILLIVSAWWYRKGERIEKELERQLQIAEFYQIQLGKKSTIQSSEVYLVATSTVPATSSDEMLVETTKSVIIQETETGWLRVRQGPGTNYPEIDRVYPGESYPQLEKINNWVKIETSSQNKGWIYLKYTKEYEN